MKNFFKAMELITVTAKKIFLNGSIIEVDFKKISKIVKTWKIENFMIHHIAIGTTNLIRLSEFYMQLPGIKLLNRNYFENSEELRSVWLQHIDGTILMLESNFENKAPLALVFEFSDLHLESFKEVIFRRTDYTIYFYDADGNVLGYSTHPRTMDNSSNF